jgi:DHA2 family multidrug resistance protein-like MFS transporter
MVISGVGFGMFQTPNNRTMIAAAPRERSGGASGMQGIARALGMTTGATLVAVCLNRDPGNGPQVALFIGAGFALLGATLSALRLSPAGARGANG